MNDSYADDIVEYDGYGNEHFGSHPADAALHGDGDDEDRDLIGEDDDQLDDDMMDRISSSPSIDDGMLVCSFVLLAEPYF